MMEETSGLNWFVYLLTGVILLYIIVRGWRSIRIWNVATDIPGPIPLPFIGSSYILLGCTLSESLSRIREMRKKHGKTAKFWLGNYLIIAVSEIVCIENIFGNSKYLDRSEMIQFVGKDMFRNGLFFNTGDTWRYHRKIISLMFHKNVLDKFVGIFSKNGTILSDLQLSEFANGEPFDVYDCAMLCTTDVIYETVLGTTVHAQKNEQRQYLEAANDYLDVLSERFRRPWFLIDYFFRMSELSKKSDAAVDFYYSHAKRALKEKYLQREIKKENSGLQNSKFNSIMDLFIESGELTEQEMLEELVTMVTAGSETSATALSFTLAALGEHHDVQDKVIEEQRRIYGDDFLRPVNSEDLQHMTYLEQVVKEVLRVLPPIGFLFRKITEDTDLGNGYVAPKGSVVVALIQEAHHDPSIYPNPEKFDPDRFSLGNCNSRHPYAYIPFGVGRRMCVGIKFAMMELKTLLSVVLRRYKVVKAVDGIAAIQKNIVLGLVNKSAIGYKIQIESR